MPMNDLDQLQACAYALDQILGSEAGIENYCPSYMGQPIGGGGPLGGGPLMPGFGEGDWLHRSQYPGQSGFAPDISTTMPMQFAGTEHDPHTGQFTGPGQGGPGGGGGGSAPTAPPPGITTAGPGGHAPSPELTRAKQQSGSWREIPGGIGQLGNDVVDAWMDFWTNFSRYGANGMPYYDPDQARDDSGKWTGGGGSGDKPHTDHGEYVERQRKREQEFSQIFGEMAAQRGLDPSTMDPGGRDYGQLLKAVEREQERREAMAGAPLERPYVPPADPSTVPDWARRSSDAILNPQRGITVDPNRGGVEGPYFPSAADIAAGWATAVGDPTRPTTVMPGHVVDNFSRYADGTQHSPDNGQFVSGFRGRQSKPADYPESGFDGRRSTTADNANQHSGYPDTDRPRHQFGGSSEYGLAPYYDPDQARDDSGKWTGGGGGGSHALEGPDPGWQRAIGALGKAPPPDDFSPMPAEPGPAPSQPGLPPPGSDPAWMTQSKPKKEDDGTRRKSGGEDESLIPWWAYPLAGGAVAGSFPQTWQFLDQLRNLMPFSRPPVHRAYSGDGTRMRWYGDRPSDDVPAAKARQILHDGEVHGHPLTDAQRGMFGAAAGR